MIGRIEIFPHPSPSLPLPHPTTRRLVHHTSVVRVLPRTFKGITDLLLAPAYACFMIRNACGPIKEACFPTRRKHPPQTLLSLTRTTHFPTHNPHNPTTNHHHQTPFGWDGWDGWDGGGLTALSGLTPPPPKGKRVAIGSLRGRERVMASTHPAFLPHARLWTIVRQRSRSLSESTRQITPPTRNGHAPPSDKSRKSSQSVNPCIVLTW